MLNCTGTRNEAKHSEANHSEAESTLALCGSAHRQYRHRHRHHMQPPVLFDIGHKQYDSIDEMNRWFGWGTFDVAQTDWNACPPNSAIKQNIIEVRLLGEGWKIKLPNDIYLGEAAAGLREQLAKLPAGRRYRPVRHDQQLVGNGPVSQRIRHGNTIHGASPASADAQWPRRQQLLRGLASAADGLRG